MQIKENLSLKPFNTFSIDVSARYFVVCSTAQEIMNTLQNHEFQELPILILGGGSNILFTGNFDGVVLKPDLQGIAVISETDTTITIEAQAGTVWDEFVNYCVQNNWGGIENLALIPGCVGASPIQNIGAYGVEVKDTFYSLKALELTTCEIKEFLHADCQFGYRDSIFKQAAKNKYIILSVQFVLNKTPKINIKYGAIQQELDAMQVEVPTIQDVYKAICAIRQSKLPDPKEIGNAGSFFKNPYISTELYLTLKQKHPSIIAYFEQDKWKIAAGWLIEQCGWKGYKNEDVGVHAKQALVLVNYGAAKGADIISLAKQIQTSVFDTFGIEIHPEVNFI